VVQAVDTSREGAFVDILSRRGSAVRVPLSDVLAAKVFPLPR
jgi:hypothetical protein